MEYQEVKGRLETLKLELVNKLQEPDLSIEERMELKRTIDNYEYIIELADMNHFERGKVIH